MLPLAYYSFPNKLKFLWAPLLDRYTLPFLGRRLGWLMVLQLLLLIIMAAYSLLHPGKKLLAIVVLTGLLTFISATQDIVSDALRREILSDHELGLGSSLYVTAYRLANLVPGSLALVLSDHLPWFWVFIITSLFMLVGLWIIPLTHEPKVNIAAPKNIQELIIAPLKEYWQRRGSKMVILVMAFFFLYKFGDNLASGASVVFYNDIGFSRTVIGTVVKYSQVSTSIIGTIIGGILMLKTGVNRALWLFGIVQLISILGFAWLASFGYLHHIGRMEELYLALVVAFEYLGVGLGTTAFIAYLARETNPVYAAVQLALLSAIATTPRTIFGAYWGKLVEIFVYYHFFWLCFFLALPGMIILLWVAPWNEKTRKN